MLWRGGIVSLQDGSPDPREDVEAMALMERIADDDLAVHLCDCWKRGYDEAPSTALGLGLGERSPFLRTARTGVARRRAMAPSTPRSRDRIAKRTARHLGSLARARGLGRLASEDLAIQHLLGGRSERTRLSLTRAWERGWDDEGEQVACRMAGVAAARDLAFTKVRIARSYRWIGQLAYAKGIDRSPSHDRATRHVFAQEPNEIVLVMLRAWEAGWDEARDSARQLGLERRCALDLPRILDQTPAPTLLPRRTT